MTIKTQLRSKARTASLLSLCIVLLTGELAQAKTKYTCDQEKPETMCTADNTCGSASSPCTVAITRSNTSANVKPSIPNAKNNQIFCVKAGTTVVWMSPKKSQGFTVSFGTDSPFDPNDTIMGGGQKPVTTKASTPGCYKYDVGAFTSGTVYGMGGGTMPELIILP